MLSVNNISKSYGAEPILNNISFTMNQGEKIGLVGLNGSGKTTLLRILAKEDTADSGSVLRRPGNLRVGFLPQGLTCSLHLTIKKYLTDFDGDQFSLSSRLEKIASDLIQEPGRKDLIQEYDRLLSLLASMSENQVQATSILARLGLGGFPPNTPIDHLSGGQKTRLALAGVLISNPQLLLLDEPTNHLDIEMLEWLEQWVISSPCAALIVSHDRTFLDNCVDSILELDAHTHQAHKYTGNYSSFLTQKQHAFERNKQAYADQQTEIIRLRKSAASVRSQAQYHKGGKTDPAKSDRLSKGFFADRSKATIRKAKNIEKRIEQMLTDEHVDKPLRIWEMKIDFENQSESGRDVVVMEDLSIGYGKQVVLAGLNQTLCYGQRTVLIGPNGSGKTTLLRTITGQILPQSGTIRLGSRVICGIMAQEQENLPPDKTPLQALMDIHSQSETEVRSFLSKFLFKSDDVFVPISHLSYGERARLSLACLVAHGCNLLLLDEPINHLDIPSRVQFEKALSGFQGTILAVMHDRYFIRRFASQIWKIESGKLLRVFWD